MRTSWSAAAIRFSGPTADLLARPDLLRSVFLSHDRCGEPTADGLIRSRAAADDGRPRVLAASVSSLACSFGGIRAVDNVSFAVAEREIVGIIGPNGAGKTTLFDLISGFIPADGGSVVLGWPRRHVARPRGRAARGLGRSFQDARLFPDMTVRETLSVALERWFDQSQRAGRGAAPADGLRRRGAHCARVSTS